MKLLKIFIYHQYFLYYNLIMSKKISFLGLCLALCFLSSSKGQTDSTAQKAEQKEKVGSFWVIRKQDAFTDEESNYIYTSELNGPKGRKGALYVSCQTDGRVTPLLAADAVINLAPVPIYFRIGTAKPVEDSWLISKTGKAAFVPKRSSYDFMISLAASEKFAAQILKANWERPIYEFNLNGFSEALAKLGCAPKLNAKIGDSDVSGRIFYEYKCKNINARAFLNKKEYFKEKGDDCDFGSAAEPEK